jgi:hypothetical protein
MGKPYRAWRPRPWAAVVATGAVATVIVAHRQRSRSRLIASVAVLAGQAAAYANARRAIQHALQIGPGRRTFEQERARAFRDLLLDDGTHAPSFAAAEAALGRLQDAALSPRAATAAALARREITEIERQLRETRAQRESEQDLDHKRRLGGFAPQAPSRIDDPLALYGVRPRLPARVPPAVADVVEQVGLVLDEVRLLHTAEIEWSTLLFTLWARAALVGLAPALSTATAAPVRLGRSSSVIWAAAAGLATATASAGPRVADAAMDRGAAGRRVRRRLLLAEVPVSCLLLYTQPSWMTATFASGWTNWEQRPDFEWWRLAGFVFAVIGLQSAGMARREVPRGRAASEIAASLAIIFYTGASYGAMLPLSVSTTVHVVRRGVRPLRAVREARERMLHVAAVLRAVAAEAAPRGDAGAVELVLEAATTLESNASAIEQPPNVLFELVETAYRHSEVPLGETPAAAERAHEAELAGEPAPVELRTPDFGAGETLRTAVMRSPPEAKALHNLIVALIGEADLHGMVRAYVSFEVEEGRLVLRLGNERRNPPRQGRRGSGRARIERLAHQLPGGTVDRREEVTGEFVGLRPRPGWFGVQISCSADVLSGFPERVGT